MPQPIAASCTLDVLNEVSSSDSGLACALSKLAWHFWLRMLRLPSVT